MILQKRDLILPKATPKEAQRVKKLLDSHL